MSEPAEKKLKTDSGDQTILLKTPKLFLAKFSEAVATTAKLAKKMSTTGWHGRGDSIVVEGCAISGLDDTIAEDLRAKAGEVQQHIEGIALPGSESDFEGYAFVADFGSETDLKTVLSIALGIRDDAREYVTLTAKTFKYDFAGVEEQAKDLDEEPDAKKLERLLKATAILKAHGETYEMNFTEDVICGPVLHFAQDKGSMLILGVIGGRVWT